MICAITGANGLVGTWCSRWLIGRGHGILRLVRQPQGPDAVPFDLRQNTSDEYLRRVDALVHCAYDFSARDWATMQAVNVTGSVRLFRKAKKASVKTLIFISSVSAFEGCQSLYGKAKLEVEKAASELGALVIRPGLVFGDPARGMFGALNRMTALPVLPVFDGGRQPMVLVHVEDLAQLIGVMLECEAGGNPGPVIAANDEQVAFRDILLELARRRGKKLRFISFPGSLSLASMRLVERVGLRLPFSSDSLVSLLNPPRQMDFTSAKRWGICFRRFHGE